MDLRLRLAELDSEREALLALQLASYAVEARLIGVPQLPVHSATTSDLENEAFWVAELDEEIVALLILEDSEELVINTLVVHPDQMGQGIGRALVKHALALAGTRPVRVGTAAANTPALELYASMGFERVGERTVGDGLAYVDLRSC